MLCLNPTSTCSSLLQKITTGPAHMKNAMHKSCLTSGFDSDIIFGFDCASTPAIPDFECTRCMQIGVVNWQPRALKICN